MKTCKVNPLKLNETNFDSKYMKEKGRYVKRYFFANGLGAIVSNHDNSYGGHSGYFEVWIVEYKHGTDPNMSYKVLESHPIHKRHGAVEVFGWLDFLRLLIDYKRSETITREIIATMNNKEYNGWYNYETWMVNLWMDNDQGSHEMWREHARDSIDADEGCNWFLFEDRLKSYLDMIQEDVDNGVACGLVHDLLGAAISEVNTREISMHWIADELENMEITE